MGCDIHLHIEVKLDGVWEHWGNPPISRSYALFAKMVGVRNYDGEEPIGTVNGLPADVTTITRYVRDYDGTDGHSDSWLNLEQIERLMKWYESLPREDGYRRNFERVFGYLMGNAWVLCQSHPRITDIRFVFWFDN